MILVADSGMREIDRAEIEAGRPRLSCVAPASRVHRGLGGHEGDQVADVHHADRIVERVVVDDEPRMAGALEHLHQFAERDVLLHRDDVGARHHDVVDPALAQRQDVLEHGALFRREAGFAGARRFEHDFEVGAGRTALPAEQRARQAREEAIALARPVARGTGTGRLRWSFEAPACSAGRPGASESGMVAVQAFGRRVQHRDREWRGA